MVVLKDVMVVLKDVMVVLKDVVVVVKDVMIVGKVQWSFTFVWALGEGQMVYGTVPSTGD